MQIIASTMRVVLNFPGFYKQAIWIDEISYD